MQSKRNSLSQPTNSRKEFSIPIFKSEARSRSGTATKNKYAKPIDSRAHILSFPTTKSKTVFATEPFKPSATPRKTSTKDLLPCVRKCEGSLKLHNLHGNHMNDTPIVSAHHPLSCNGSKHLLRKKRLFDTRINCTPFDTGFERLSYSPFILKLLPSFQILPIFYFCDFLRVKRESLEPNWRLLFDFPF